MNQSLYEAIESLESDPRMRPFVIERIDELHELIHVLTEENERLREELTCKK